MRTVLLNKVLTVRGGGRYEAGKYIDVRGRQYYVSGFFFHCDPACCHVWMDGRFKGEKFRTPLLLAAKKKIAEPLIISRDSAEFFREQAGRGKKPRFVMTSDGYIYLPDVLMFDEPWEIMRWAADETITWHHELHRRKPKRRFFADWVPEENGFKVGTGEGES